MVQQVWLGRLLAPFIVNDQVLAHYLEWGGAFASLLARVRLCIEERETATLLENHILGTHTDHLISGWELNMAAFIDNILKAEVLVELLRRLIKGVAVLLVRYEIFIEELVVVIACLASLMPQTSLLPIAILLEEVHRCRVH